MKNKIGYVDGFVVVVPKKNVTSYKRMAKIGERIWKKHGALDYKECVGEDLKNPWSLPFPKLAKLKPGETVFFSYIGYKSRKHRDQVNARVHNDPSMSPEAGKEFKMPFDMKRMAYGGFKVLVG